jgi:nucleotide-binding universal stress UspA family protein
MSDQPIGHILCAVRSQPSGERTVEHAIDLALAHEARITFAQIVDAEFVALITSKPAGLQAIYRELTGMAEFAMMVVSNQAALRGVKGVDHVVRQGQVPKMLLALAGEERPDVLVMGRPGRTPGRNIFTEATLEAFAGEVEEKTGVRVIMVD